MSDTSIHGDSTFATISIISVILGSIGLGDIGIMVGIFSGGVSLYINWPKAVDRWKKSKLFKRKKP